MARVLYKRAELRAPRCPRCSGIADRVGRRFADRLLSLFRPVLRYQCRACPWRGNL